MRPRTMMPGTDPAAGWKTLAGLGDANWTLGDAAVPGVALLVRHMGLAVLTGFGANLPARQPYEYGVALNNDLTYGGPFAMQFIQTLQGESANPLLDAVMLARLPLQYHNASGNLVNVPGPLGQPNPGGRPVLIRNI